MAHTIDSLMITEQKALHTEEHQEEESNFIAFLRYERFSNKTAEFNKLYNSLQPLCYSYALLLLNKE
jgi:hypothetical protein